METILYNGHVRTLAPVARRHEAVAISNGRIAELGSSRSMLALASERTRLVDLRGRTLLPGLIDSHAHAMLTGLVHGAVRLATARSVAEVCERVEAKAAESEEDKWVFAVDCVPLRLEEGRFPTMQELDRVAPAQPAVVLCESFHSLACNSRAFEAIDPDLSAHGVQKDSSGRPTGVLESDDTVFPAVRKAIGSLTDDDLRDMYRGVAAEAVSRGVTTMHCLDGQFVEEDRDIYVLMSMGPELPVHTVVMYQTMDVPRVLDLGLPRIGGCLTVDGAGFEHTMLLHEPYPDDPTNYGDLYISEEKIRQFVLEAHRAGLQIGMHAMGDRAIDILVGSYAAAMADYPRDDCRHRVEHFFLPSERAVERAGELGLSLTMQPVFSWRLDQRQSDEVSHTIYDAILGPERAARVEPFARLRDLGAVVGGGSDSPVTEIAPLMGIHSLVNNPRQDRRVGVEDALRVFTANNAWIAFEEQDKGTIEVGKLADLVVLDRDPYLEPGSIMDFEVNMTMVAGEVVYDRSGFVGNPDT